MMKCRICGARSGSELRAREEMLGLGGSFTYWQCDDCGCLQLVDIPADLSVFYPKNYYSFNSKNASQSQWKLFRRGLKRRLVLNHPFLIGWLMKLLVPNESLFWIYRRIGVTGLSRVLDVGCGDGKGVLDLRGAGVTNALGADVYIPSDIFLNGKILVHKKSLFEMNGEYDFIMFHHSLEHMDGQKEILEHAKSLLATGGKILVRIPTVTSDAFDLYKEKWCQLDAPRHLYLHSHASLRLLAGKVGMRVTQLWCDSSEFQFLGSEQYRDGIPLFADKSYFTNKKASRFSSAEIRHFKQQAKLANEHLRGDQVCAVLEAV